MTELLTIGEVAERVGVATSTLRYYDDIGLVTPATRISGQRRYAPRAVRRLRIIESCQQAGFTLDEVGQLLDGEGDWQDLARRKRAEIRDRIRRLQEAERLVDAALDCGCEHLEGCDRLDHETCLPVRVADATFEATDLTDPTSHLIRAGNGPGG